MSKLRGLVLLLFVGLVVGGCTTEGPAGKAVIVAVPCSDDLGCETMIAFLDDGSRWKRDGRWGNVGDTLSAQRTWGDMGQRWQAPQVEDKR